MSKISTIIVDDEPRGINHLIKMLEIHCPDILVADTCSNADEAKQKVSLLQPALLLLDIAMPGKSGIDFLHEMAGNGFEVIFITAHEGFLLQALQLSAVDYLMKPVDTDLLIEAVSRAAMRIENKANYRQPVQTLLNNLVAAEEKTKMKLCIPSLKGFQVVSIADIIYCEAKGNYTDLHFTDRTSTCSSKAINDYDLMLEDSGFIRVHKSFLVNIEHIKEYIKGEGGKLLLTNLHEVDVSRRKKEQLLNKVKEYYKS